ncbi:MAG: linear amide C-N hydrolase [Oscillospiraceae bacterium]|nr:linear amide C-N hydrolase [Oscillospiraceae bacterium]
MFKPETPIQLIRVIKPTKNSVRLDSSSTVSLFRGNDGVNEFLSTGGVANSGELVKFVLTHLAGGYKRLPMPAPFQIQPGCTAIQVPNRYGQGYLFGRNYDFEPHTMLILQVEPEDGYRSVSSVDTTFITNAFGKAGCLLPAWLIKSLGLYLPVDGMNEKGLALSVNMIADDAIITQDTGKPRQIIVTAVRTLLDKAANVDEALHILSQCDMRSWKGFFCHLAIADAQGNCVAVEYIDDKMVVNRSPVITNFYLQRGPKYGIGTEQSHIRYDQLMEMLAEHPTLSAEEMRDALRGVAKSNFPDDFHTTEWSIVYDQEKLTATYYRREDYTHAWRIQL